MALYQIDTTGQLEPHVQQEWLLTNGIGGYAGSTVVGCNTRRYHGLLIAATRPPVGRIMALNRIGELLNFADSDVTHEFSVNQFPQAYHPRGDQYLRRFELNQAARWVYQIEDVRITKEVQILWERNITGIRYTIEPANRQTVKLQLLPFVSLRDFHALRHRDCLPQIRPEDKGVLVRFGQNELHMVADGGQFEPQGDWWYDHFYAIEAERGQDCMEDLFSPGRFTVMTGEKKQITIWAGISEVHLYDWDKELERGRTQRASHVKTPLAGNASRAMVSLHRAAEDFIVTRPEPDGTQGTSIIAGYPWFSDWGRDTMISLPGLLLTTHRYEQARQVLNVYARYVSQGMIPNRFDDYTSEPTYNTVDASLWFVNAVFAYVKATGDTKTFEQRLLPACRQIIDGYRTGTRFFIRMDPDDGLITQGDASTQLTWMDAKCDGIAFTPRQGKAVEINALWYNALRLLKEDALADQVRDSFRKAFWISPWRGLADVTNENGQDASIRPNQIFAVSLPHSALTDEQQAAVVEVVRRELLTPMGLRTLAASDGNFHPDFSGPQRQRDEAYHNGTIWPWLIGAFLESYLKVNHASDASVQQARAWLMPLIQQMETQSCIGQIDEVFEAKEPHRRGGCPAQAWSVAEVLRMATRLKL